MSSNIKVEDIMVKDVITIEKGKSIVDAAKLMKQNKIGSVVIIEKKKAVGIITERDLVRKAIADNNISKKVEELMSKPIIVVRPETSIEDASKVMSENKIKRLLVIDRDDSLLGIITEDDIIKILPSLVDLVEEKAYAYKE